MQQTCFYNHAARSQRSYTDHYSVSWLIEWESNYLTIDRNIDAEREKIHLSDTELDLAIMSFPLSKSIDPRARATFDLQHLIMFETGLTPKLMKMLWERFNSYATYVEEITMVEQDSRLSQITFTSFKSLFYCYLCSCVILPFILMTEVARDTLRKAGGSRKKRLFVHRSRNRERRKRVLLNPAWAWRMKMLSHWYMLRIYSCYSGVSNFNF